MQLIPININNILLLGEQPANNIDLLSKQAIATDDLQQKLELLTNATKLVEKFHSYFHFEQSYFHLRLAILYHQIGDEENLAKQLEAAIFQDHLNKQAEQMLQAIKISEIYQRPFVSFAQYLSFAAGEDIQTATPVSFWAMKSETIADLEQIITEIRKHHLAYHQESAKLYLNRALLFYKLKQTQLAKNDLVKAHNLDINLDNQEYHTMILSQISTKIILGLGSNLGDREDHLKQAIAKLEDLHILKHPVCSKIIESKAHLKPGSPKEWNLNYLNMAISGDTLLTPDELLKQIKDIEQMIGRKSSIQWSPREIDIDILAYGDEVITQDNLQIPHPNLLDRPWAIIPFAEIHPNWIHPITHQTIQEIRDEQN